MQKKFIGGLVAGESRSLALNCTWPLAFLSFDSDHIKIGCRFSFTKKHTLAYADIQSVRLERILFFTRMRILHQSPQVPAYLLFWSPKTKEICDTFAQHGVEVTQK